MNSNFSIFLERATQGAVKFFGHLIIFNTLVVEEEKRRNVTAKK
jgi:hypothetical protein